jgi:hypothetical protein
MTVPASAIARDGSFNASVANETDLSSPVTVTGDGYTISFDGNGFASKHLRRIRRNSVSALTNASTAPTKLVAYGKEARAGAALRFGKAESTNSVVFLDLSTFCQLGAAIAKALKTNTDPWEDYGHGANVTKQKHVSVTLPQCLSYSHSGVGSVRSSEGGIEAGVGMTLDLTVRKVGGSDKVVEVCHYEGGKISNKFGAYQLDPKLQAGKMQGIAKSIVRS